MDNLYMNETGIGGWGGQFHVQSFHARQYITMTTLHGTRKLTDSPFAQSSATLVLHILAGSDPCLGCPASAWKQP